VLRLRLFRMNTRPDHLPVVDILCLLDDSVAACVAELHEMSQAGEDATVITLVAGLREVVPQLACILCTIQTSQAALKR